MGVRRTALGVLVVALLPFAGCSSSDGPSKEGKAIDPSILDMVLPVDPDSFVFARRDFYQLLRRAQVPAMQECMRTEGVDADETTILALDRETFGIATVNFPSLGLMREWRTFSVEVPPFVQNTSLWDIAPYEAAYATCSGRGRRLRSKGQLRAEQIVDQLSSLFWDDLREVDVRLDEQGAFPSACIEEIGVPPDRAGTPDAFFGWAEEKSYEARDAGEPKPWRMDLADAYERCTKDYYKQLRAILEQRREDLLETERENIEELQELRDELVAAEEGPTRPVAE